MIDPGNATRAPRPTSVPGRRSSSTSRARPGACSTSGCATGTTGAALKQRQEVEVVGVELEPEYAREAATRLDHVIDADVPRAAEPEGRFDALIAADILEHLRTPGARCAATRSCWSPARPWS